MKSFFEKLNKTEKYMIINMFFVFAIQGLYVLGIGSVIPMMREEYGLNYTMSGALLSAHNIGTSIGGLTAGVLALLMGMKPAFIVFNAASFVGFAVTIITGNPIALIIGFILTGLGRGVVSNFDNLAVSTIGEGNSAPCNMLHSCFSIGALLSPLMVLACVRSGGGWKLAMMIIIGFLVVSTLTSIPMNMDRVSYDSGDRHADRSWKFLKDPMFVYPAVIMFFYQCVEASLMGWMVSYFIDGGLVTEASTQALSSLLWASILVGRLVCIAFADKISSPKLVLVLSSTMLVFSLILLMTKSPLMVYVATIGLGLGCSGMYGTTVACAGDTFGKYTLAMSIFTAIAGAGAALWPSVVGKIADLWGMQIGMGSILIPGVILFVVAILQKVRKVKN